MNYNHVLCTNNDGIPSLFVHRTTWQVFYKDFARQDIPRYILKIKENLISRNPSQLLLPSELLLFLSTFNNDKKVSSQTTDQQLFLFQFNSFTRFCLKDINFFLQQFFSFSQSIYTSFFCFISASYISS